MRTAIPRAQVDSDDVLVAAVVAIASLFGLSGNSAVLPLSTVVTLTLAGIVSFVVWMLTGERAVETSRALGRHVMHH